MGTNTESTPIWDVEVASSSNESVSVGCDPISTSVSVSVSTSGINVGTHMGIGVSAHVEPHTQISVPAFEQLRCEPERFEQLRNEPEMVTGRPRRRIWELYGTATEQSEDSDTDSD